MFIDSKIMADKEEISIIQARDSTTADYVSIEGPTIQNSDVKITANNAKLQNPDVKIQTEESAKLNKSMSLDAGEREGVIRNSISRSGSFKRRSIRRRSSKRSSRLEPEFGHDTETYEKIRERVLQERAVTNAIDALQERWRMIMFMYDDCVELNKERVECKLKKLCIRRQFELIMIILAFVLVCFLISVVFIFINR